MDTQPEISADQAFDMPVAAHVDLVPEGISSLRDIAGLERATQGERAMLKDLQYAIELHAGQPVPEFWAGVWATLARGLRMQTVYLVQMLKPLSSHDYFWLRTLFAVESRGAESANPQTLSSGIYEQALHTKPSEHVEPAQAIRLDTQRGAYSKIPRSVEAQVQNEGLTGFYLQEVHTLAEKQSKITSFSGDGTNYLKLLPVSEELTRDGDFYLAFDRPGDSETLASFAEMIELLHQRLNPALNDFIQVLLRTAHERPLPESAASARVSHPLPGTAVVFKPADGQAYPVLSRSLMLSASPGWPWHRRVAGLFAVEGASGAALDKAAQDIYRLLNEDFAKLTKADAVAVLELFWTWHVKVYLLAKEAQLPIRVNGSILSRHGKDWEMYNLGTAPPVLHLTADAQTPVRYEVPNKDLCFLGYNPLATISTRKLTSKEALATERMSAECFAGAHRALGQLKPGAMILFSSGWLEQCDPQQGPGFYEGHYGIQRLLACLKQSAAEGGRESGEQLAQRLAQDAQPYAAAVYDAGLLVWPV